MRFYMYFRLEISLEQWNLRGNPPYWTPSWILEMPPRGFLGSFDMFFHMILPTTGEKFSFVQIFSTPKPTALMLEAMYQIWKKSAEWLLRSRVHKILSPKIRIFAINSRILRKSKNLFFVAQLRVIRKLCIKFERNPPSGCSDLVCTRF